MNYSLKRTNRFKLIKYVSITGFVVEPTQKYKVRISKIVLMDNDMIHKYIISIINKKFDKLFKKMYQVLIDENTGEDDDTPLILNEIARLKAIVINTYKSYIDEKTYKAILRKLLIAEDEFKKKYYEKQIYLSEMAYISSGKSK